MGYGSGAKPTPIPFEKPHIFDTIEEPVELRKFVDDAIFLMGGQFAIICQFAKPALAEGSYKHSNFAHRILNRLQTTARFLNAAVLGDQHEKEAIFSVIHRAHADVQGENYSADDPELRKSFACCRPRRDVASIPSGCTSLHLIRAGQCSIKELNTDLSVDRWTAATLFVSLIVVHEAFYGKLPQERLEKLYRESAVYGTSLRMPPEMWPPTLEDFWTYWHHEIATLEITDWARSLAKDLLWPKHVPLWLKVGSPVARLMTVQWLPERLQREFGFKVTPMTTGMYHLVAGYVAMVYPHVPKSLRTRPARVYIADMKKAVKHIDETGDWPRLKG